FLFLGAAALALAGESPEGGYKAFLRDKPVTIQLKRKTCEDALNALRDAGIRVDTDDSFGDKVKKAKVILDFVEADALEVLGELAARVGAYYDIERDRVVFRVRPPRANPEDVADIPSWDFFAWGDPRKRYFLIGPRRGARPPKTGYGLVLILPGGPGTANFHPFVKRIYKNAIPSGFVGAQPVSVRWRDDQRIIWPIRGSDVEGMEFNTETFVERVTSHVRSKLPIDGRRIFTISWSSSGPACYPISLLPERVVTGSLIAMSVFHQHAVPPLENAKGHPYFLYHSPDDRMCPIRLAELAERLLKENGASVKLMTYAGGHGWRGPLFAHLREGIEWIDERAVEEKKTVLRSLGGRGVRVDTAAHTLLIDPVHRPPSAAALKGRETIVMLTGPGKKERWETVLRRFGVMKTVRFVLTPAVDEKITPGVKRGKKITVVAPGEKKTLKKSTVHGLEAGGKDLGILVHVDGIALFRGCGPGAAKGKGPVPETLPDPSGKAARIALLCAAPGPRRTWSLDFAKKWRPRNVLALAPPGQEDRARDLARALEAKKVDGLSARFLGKEDALVVKD
ncbi:MAG: alpha/beta hydrolase, partial [Planctomycetota bacterium]